MIFILKERQRSITSRPIFPNPTIPSVLFRSSVPSSLWRFHSPFSSPLCPWGILRDKASIRATVCSAAEMVFTSGVFITTIPFRVAAVISILSTPTPALPITCRFCAELIMSTLTCVPLRMIQPSTSTAALCFSSSEPSGK